MSSPSLDTYTTDLSVADFSRVKGALYVAFTGSWARLVFEVKDSTAKHIASKSGVEHRTPKRTLFAIPVDV